MATFTNQATLSYNDAIINSNTVTGEIVDPITVAKNAGATSYNRNDIVPYSMTLVNSGTTAYNNLTVTDNLGEYTVAGTPAQTYVPLTYVPDSVRYYVNGVLQAAPTVTQTNPLTITGINVPAGGNAVILYSARPNQYAPLGTTAQINNTVSVTGAGFVDPLTADATLPVATGAALTITKSLSPTTTTSNGQITYTFIIANNGPTPVTTADTVAVTDTFNPRLNITGVTFNGTTWAETTNYTYNAATGVFSTVQGGITVPAATYAQNPTTGEWTVTPGTSTLVITGTI